jgi:hypothetical protein
MTREEILTAPAGRDIDALVAKAFDLPLTETVPPGEQGEGQERLIPYSTEIAFAWPIFLRMNDRLFSVRQRFYQALADLAWGRAGGSRVLWPDVLTVLRHEFPECVCRAALIALEKP